MINPKEIKEKVDKWWIDGTYLASILKNENYFPREVPKIKLVDVSKVHEDYQKIIKEQEALKSFSKDIKGFGYTLEWEEKNYQKIGRNKFVKRIVFETEMDFLKYLGKEKDFLKFKENINLILSEIPQLESWVVSNPTKIVEYSEKWMDLLKVCNYFMKEHVPGKYYIRELPISIHTKFIEQHKSIISNLLEFLIPDKIAPNSKNDFCFKFGLKDKESAVRIRILCENLKTEFMFDDFAIPLSSFKDSSFKASTIFITENLMNFLTLPTKEGSIAIWSGGGFNISYLANIDWLKNKEIYYWGDIDTAGFHILSQLRSYYSHAKSIMMDKLTFNKFYDKGEGKPIPTVELKGLKPDEFSLYSIIREGNLRLEQEKIPQEYVVRTIENLNN
jgi:hypothetical protein